MPKQFFPGVEKGVRAVADKGPTAGYPVVDFKAVLYDGSFHTVDSDELSFRLAASMATRKGIAKCDPAPGAHHGGRGASAGGWTWARSTATSTPVVAACWAWTPTAGAEPAGARTPGGAVHVRHGLRSITGGRGTFSAHLSTYEEVPAHVAQKVIDAHKAEADEDD